MTGIQSLWTGNRPELICKLARSLDDVMQAMTVRAAVYVGEETCPYPEEYDGNDFCAAHFVGYLDGEPAGCLRVRTFAKFAKLERLAVRREFRGNGLARLMVEEAKAFCRRKGYGEVIAHARKDRISFWSDHGFIMSAARGEFIFSDYSYVEMACSLVPERLSQELRANPYLLIRPENDWGRPGILETSAKRPSRSDEPKRGRHAA